MKFYGDIPEHHKNLASRLEKAELEAEQSTMVAARKAQSYVCLAHDWYDIGMEEEGERLLLKAETIYPGYFDKLIVEHMKKSPDFHNLVKNISSELASIALGYLNVKK